MVRRLRRAAADRRNTGGDRLRPSDLAGRSTAPARGWSTCEAAWSSRGSSTGWWPEHGSKGTLLSHCTLELVAEVLRPLGDESIRVLCDKHGGRDRYAGLLGEHFPDWLIETRAEGRSWSSYQFGPPQRRVEFGFQAKGESHLPAALASMTSKYLRELAMRPLNEFWARRVERLRPTAGYPVDAARFMADIASARTQLGIEEDMLWRVR